MSRIRYTQIVKQVQFHPKVREVGSGVSELRLKDANGIYRVFYITKISDKILVFHAFKKKTQKTPALEIELARKRLAEVLSG